MLNKASWPTEGQIDRLTISLLIDLLTDRGNAKVMKKSIEIVFLAKGGYTKK